jgi:hypothetical protein
MEKNKKRKNLTVYIFLIVVIALIAVSGSYARYTKTLSGSDEAFVAKFDVTANDVSETIDLFDFIDETAVKDGVIAPGTRGSFTTTLQNNSEVTAAYTVSATETQTTDIPIVYSLNEEGPYVPAEQLASVATGILDFPGSTKANPVTTKTIAIYWKWEYSGNDQVDTALGEAATTADENQTERPSAKVTLNITFTQVD